MSSSYDSTGANFITFWDGDTGALLHRESTRWRLDVLLWAESAALVLVCGKGDTPGSSSAITVSGFARINGGVSVIAGRRGLRHGREGVCGYGWQWW